MAKKLEIEKKFLLRKLPANLTYQKILHIFQYYLPDGSRIRETRDAKPKSGPFKGDIIPFPLGVNSKFELTKKKKIKAGVYEENEREISQKKFELLRETSVSVIKKARYVHVMNGLTGKKKLKWEIDVYHDGLHMVTAEIELPKEGVSFNTPQEIKDEMIMDVTEFYQFTNKSLSNKITWIN